MDNSLLSCFFSWVKTGSAGESGGKKPDWVIMLLREEIYWFVKSGYRTCIITKGENRLIKGLRHDWRTKAKASLSLSGVLMWSLGPLFSSQLLGLLVESLWLLLWKSVLCLKSHIYCFFCLQRPNQCRRPCSAAYEGCRSVKGWLFPVQTVWPASWTSIHQILLLFQIKCLSQPSFFMSPFLIYHLSAY